MIKSAIPHFIKRIISNSLTKIQYEVKLGKRAYVSSSKFEKYCSIGERTNVHSTRMGRSSYAGNGSNIVFAKIGRYCAIGDEVRICIGRHPSKRIVSIHPCFYSLYAQATHSYVKKKIFEEHIFIDPDKNFVVDIGNDVWVGNRVSISDGVKIGDGAIIGNSAFVTRDVEPYSVVVGIPARHLKYRFAKEQRDFLLEFQWWKKSEPWLREHAHLFQDIDQFCSYFKNEDLNKSRKMR